MSRVTVELRGTVGKVEAGAPATAQVPGGVAVAALLGAMLGLLTLAVVNVFTAASQGFNAWVHGVGKLWMPGAEGIGPYSGKETLSLVVWVGSWILLHFILRHTDMKISRWLVIFLVGVGIATTLIWPPVFEFLAGH